LISAGQLVLGLILSSEVMHSDARPGKILHPAEFHAMRPAQFV